MRDVTASKRYRFPCRHEGGTGEYHPLTLEETRELLEAAAKSDDAGEQCDIQCRLTQGIRGVVCPHPTVGPVARRIVQLDTLYVKTLQTDPAKLPGMAEEFYALLEPR